MLVYDIKSIPDISLGKYQAFADSGIEGMIEAQTQFIRQLYRASLLGSISVHFLFDYSPKREDGKKIKIRLLFCNKLKIQIFSDKLRKLVQSSSISEYFDFEEVSNFGKLEPIYSYMCTMKKKERFLRTIVNEKEKYFYVVPNWKVKEKSRLYNIFKLMSTFDEPCCYRVDLFTKKELQEQIHKSFETPLIFLRSMSKQGKLFSEYSIHNENKDPNTHEVLRQYEEWLKIVDTVPTFLCRVCSFSQDEQYSQLLIDSVLSESLESGNSTFVVKHGSFLGIEEMENIPIAEKTCEKNVPILMQDWSITFTLDEIAAFSRFPVLYDGENIELPRETDVIYENEGITLGIDRKGYNVHIPLSMFSKHMFICGVPGSGKTNTMLHIANSLWNCEIVGTDGKQEKAHIPFLILEPAKKEYRELALFDIPELIIFSPSACTKFPLRINPFEFPVGLTLSEHIGKLCQVFEGAFPILAPAPFILDRAIQMIYEKRGWSVTDINRGEKKYPTMSELYNQFALELEETDYGEEIKGNIKSVLQVRIGKLLRREMKDMFDVSVSTISPEEWLKKPIIIELEALEEGVANFVILLLCTLIRETLKVNTFEDKLKFVRHVIFIEEAHNLISSESRVDKSENSDPKVAATTFIVKMLAEVRALHEGIIIADQLPTAMAPEVIKNTNVKLVHRLTSRDDRELVGNTMSANLLQIENMAIYTKGHALFTYEGLLRPFDVQVSRVLVHGESTPDDMYLYNLMTDSEKHPVYVKLYQKEEERKWKEVKGKIQQFVKKSNQLIANLEDILYKELTYEEVEACIDIYEDTYMKFTIESNFLKSEIENISDFLGEKLRNEALELVEKSVILYMKMFEDILNIQLKN